MAYGAELIRTRFAPSPTGPLHLGHAYAAIFAAEQADCGQFLLRVEDIDKSRCRPEYVDLITQDLHWLGLNWPQPIMRQSQRIKAYQTALNQLSAMGVIYPCKCRRADIRNALAAPQEGAEHICGPDGLIYPGTCRHRSMRDAGPDDVLRLNSDAAFDHLGLETLSFTEQGAQSHLSAANYLSGVGDVILARRDMGTSYHLSVVIDDHAQQITLVTRGKDLFESTWIHVILQKLLKVCTPSYHHHRLIRDEHGKRLAKRDDARAIGLYRQDGVSPNELRQLIGL